MALGRQRERQADILVSWSEMPRSPGHVFYDKLQTVLMASEFDRFVETQCAADYASRRGRPSLPPGRYFRMLLVGYFEGIDSERGLEWRCAQCSRISPPSVERLKRLVRHHLGRRAAAGFCGSIGFLRLNPLQRPKP
jgi:hypothetical protein